MKAKVPLTDAQVPLAQPPRTSGSRIQIISRQADDHRRQLGTAENEDPDPLRLISAAEMRQRMGLKKTLFYDLCKRGVLPAIRFCDKPGAGMFFRESDVVQTLDRIIEEGKMEAKG